LCAEKIVVNKTNNKRNLFSTDGIKRI